MIKVLLIAGLVLIGLAVVRGRHGANYSAIKKLLLGLFAVAFVVSVLQPDVLTTIANSIGVGRGADLLLYVLAMIVIFLSLNTHLRFRDNRARVDRLARAMAVQEAARRYGRITVADLPDAGPPDAGVIDGSSGPRRD
jgi:hypothetical protein